MSTLIHNLAGRRFGKLVVVEHISGSRQSLGKWRCRCDCGAEALALPDNLKRGRTRSCGCARHGKPAPNFEDLAGQVFGRLTVRSTARKTTRGWSLERAVSQKPRGEAVLSC